MRAMVMRDFGDESVLELEDVTAPEPGPGEVLLRVGAVGVAVTRDTATRSGKHPFSRMVTLPHVLGGDCAGTVEGLGEGVDPALLGARVAVTASIVCDDCPACVGGHSEQCQKLEMLGVHRWGSYAELLCVPAVNLNRIPDDLGMAEAAAMAASGCIALTQLSTGRVGAGTWTLVPGATGALGSTLLALATHLGARPVALSRRPDDVPPELAAGGVLDVGREDLTAALMQLTGGAGIEVALDNLARPDVFERYFPTLAPGGRVVISGGLNLPVSVPVGLLYIRSLSLLGVRTTNRADVARFWRLVADGFRLPPGTVGEHPLEAAPAAHAHVVAPTTSGHTVLTHAS